MRPLRNSKKKKLSLLPFILAAIVVFIVSVALRTPEANNSASSPDSLSKFNKTIHSINDPSSIWVVVNKGRILPQDYEPADLTVPSVPLRLSKASPDMMMRAEAASKLESMFNYARKDGIELMVASAYRSFASQASLYNGYVRKDGQANADASSARPGHSEHQTGFAVDVEPTSRKCEVEECFAQTPEGQWVAKNSYKHGFIISYQQGKKNLTGYKFEPWHLRYVGIPLAEQIFKTGQTLEQFFALPSASDYPANIIQLNPGA